VLSYIFSGKESLRLGVGEWASIIQKCIDHAIDKRYKTVLEVIADVEKLAATPIDAPA
jgi:hypothetical protein